jgi:hypothetical protein
LFFSLLIVLLVARFQLPLLIADAVVQAVIEAMLWTFIMRSVADGALLFSAKLEVILLGHHCRIADW